jgi:hypothetical protein
VAYPPHFETRRTRFWPQKVIMGSLRTLFLSVYASNGATRALFLPLCYTLLLSPFLILVIYFTGLRHTFNAYLPRDFYLTNVLAPIVLSAVFLLLPTRLLSGYGGASMSKDGSKRRVQSLPHWIPGSQHFWSVVIEGDSWLKGVRWVNQSCLCRYG